MIVTSRNKGVMPAYRLDGNLLTVEEALTVNLAAYEQDDVIRLIIYRDRRGCLFLADAVRTDGLDRESCYVAEITVPARRYVSDRKAVYEGDLPVVQKRPVPFSPDGCTLALYAKGE